MKRKILPFLLILATTLPLSAQQVLHIVGDDNTAAPELYIQDGADAFIYVQGGVTVWRDAANTNTKAPEIVVNGGLFVDVDAGTPGDIENRSGFNVRFDKTTSGAFSITTPPVTAHAQVPATVHLMANGGQRIYNTTGTGIAFYNLSVDANNAGAAQERDIVSDGAAYTVTVGTHSGSPASGDGILYLRDDIVNTHDNTLEVRNSSVSAIEREAGLSNLAIPAPGMDPSDQFDIARGMVTSDGDGRLGRLIPAAAATPYLFPTGSNTSRYNPAAVLAAASDMYYVRAVDAGFNINTYVSGPTNLIPQGINPNTHWFIGTGSGVNTTTNVRLYDNITNIQGPASACSPSVLLQSLGVAQTNGAAHEWIDENAPFNTGGGNAFGPATSLLYAETTNETTNGTDALVTRLNGQGERFTLDIVDDSLSPAPSCFPFPFDILDIAATPVNNNFIRINWSTVNEINSDGFQLERSENGIYFNPIGDQDTKAPNGTSQVPLYYDHNDFNVYPNVLYYYRVKQIDVDGGYKYSSVVNAMLTPDGVHIGAAYPNPTNGELNVNIYAPEGDNFKFAIYNMLGQEIYVKSFDLPAGNSVTTLDLSALSYGSYQLVVKQGGKDIGSFKVVRF